MNCKMPALKAAFEAAGFTEVKTVLGSGNVVFSARSTSEPALQQKSRGRHAGAARPGVRYNRATHRASCGSCWRTDPYQPFQGRPQGKRIVTFLRGRPKGKIALPIEMHGARILSMEDGKLFSAYLPTPKGPVFMTLIEKTFGKDLTTRTWDTVAKVAR